MKASDRKQFESIMRRLKAAQQKQADWYAEMRHRYGTENWSDSWLKASERKRKQQLREFVNKAHDQLFAWLDQHSPWEWRSGCATGWIYANMTVELATSETPPILPPESASWGTMPVSRPAMRRWHKPE